MIQNTESNTQETELEFRIRFKKDYGIDYLEALDRLKKMKEQSELKWQQTLVKYGLINKG